MSWKPENETTEKSALIPWKGRAITKRGERLAATQEKGFVRALGHFWGWVKGYTADDINRLKEAGVRKVEAMTAKDLADAEEKIGAAAKAHAEAAKAHAEARAIDFKTSSDLMNAQLNAIARLEDIVSRIKQRGGNIAFDQNELTRKILEIGKRHPDDQTTRQLLQDASDSE